MIFNFILNGLSGLLFVVLTLYVNFSIRENEDRLIKFRNIISLNGILFLMLSFLYFSWVIGYLKPSSKDFVFLMFVINVLTSIFITYLIFKITENTNIIYLTVFYISTIFAINHSLNSFFIFSMGVSYLLVLLVSLELIFDYNILLKISGFIGLLYSIVSMIFLILITINYKPYNMWWFIPNILLILMYYIIFLYFKEKSNNFKLKIKNKYKKKFDNIYLIFVKFIIFIIAINLFVLLSVISFHEFGHVISAQFYGCEHAKAIIFDLLNYPHTEIVCSGYFNDFIISLGGLMVTILLFLIFYITGNNFIKLFSFLILGYSLIISFRDYIDLGISNNIQFLIMALSILFLIKVNINLSQYYLDQNKIIKKEFKFK